MHDNIIVLKFCSVHEGNVMLRLRKIKSYTFRMLAGFNTKCFNTKGFNTKCSRVVSHCVPCGDPFLEHVLLCNMPFFGYCRGPQVDRV